MNLLLIDGDAEFRSSLQRGLEDRGMTCAAAEDGEQGLQRMGASGGEAFELVLLDVVLPGISGWAVLERLRLSGGHTPAIFLTEQSALAERVKGLHLGADDYITKPCDLSELVARIEAVRRRHDSPADARAGPMRIDVERHVVECRGVRIEMSPREFSLLFILARARGRTLSRDELLRQVWGIDFDPGTNAVEVLVSRLRRRIAAWAPDLIHTVAGQGYVLGEQRAPDLFPPGLIGARPRRASTRAARRA